MGGNALKQKTKRLDKKEYFSLLERKVFPFLSPNSYHLVRAYQEKESFGDADVVLYSNNYLDRYDFIKEVFSPTEIVVNSNCYSFDIENFQIDFIFHHDEIFNIACHYYDFSPLGNLVGKLFHPFDLSFGHNGLLYKVHEKDFLSEGAEYLEKIPLTRNIHEIFNFVGLDSDCYKKEFSKQEEIFEFVYSSKFFDTDLFSFENMNHRARVRDKKRIDYNQFLVFLKTKKVKTHQFNKDLVHEKFPFLKDEIKKISESYFKKKELKEKFNGKIVAEITNLEGKELGEFILKFKKIYTNFENFLDDHSKDEIKSLIRNIFSSQT
jgi:hypothetical protein